MGRRSATLLACSVAWACTEPTHVPLPPDTRTTILVRSGGDAVQAYAHDLLAGSRGLDVPIEDTTEELTLLAYTRSMAELQLTEGELELAPPGAASRPLPRAESVYVAIARDAFAEWVQTGTLTPTARAVRLPRETFESCAAREGCSIERPEEGICQPCPEPSRVVPPSFADVPTPPAFRPCPAGWAALEVDSFRATEFPTRTATVCDPDPSALDCGVALALPGAAACRSVGPACPADRWRDLQGDVSYVDAATAGGGDGTRAAPFATIAAAIAQLRPGATIALAAGDYASPGVLPAGARLAGACVARSRITGELTASGTIEGVSLPGGTRAAGVLRLDGVVVDGRLDGAPDALVLRGSRVSGAMVVRGGSVAVEDSVLDGPLELDVIGTATVTASRLGGGLDARGGERVVVDGSLVRGVESSATRTTLRRSHLRGSLVHTGGSLTLDRLWIQGDVATVDTVTAGTDVVLQAPRGVVPADGEPLRVTRGSLALTRAFVEGGATAGISATEVLLSLRDVAVLSVAPGSRSLATCIHSAEGSVELDRVLLEGCRGPGLQAEGTGAVSLTDVRVHGTGDGVRIYRSRRARLERVAFEAVSGQSLVVGEVGFGEPAVAIQDVRIHRTQNLFCRLSACPIAGLSLGAGSLVASRIVVSDSEEIGLRVVGGELVLVDGSFDDNALAVQIEQAGFDLDRLAHRVRYRRNAQLLRVVPP